MSGFPPLFRRGFVQGNRKFRRSFVQDYREFRLAFVRPRGPSRQKFRLCFVQHFPGFRLPFVQAPPGPLHQIPTYFRAHTAARGLCRAAVPSGAISSGIPFRYILCGIFRLYTSPCDFCPFSVTRGNRPPHVRPVRKFPVPRRGAAGPPARGQVGIGKEFRQTRRTGASRNSGGSPGPHETRSDFPDGYPETGARKKVGFPLMPARTDRGTARGTAGTDWGQTKDDPGAGGGRELAELRRGGT